MGMVPTKGSIFYLPAIVLSFLCLFLHVGRSGARATTDSSEVEALNAILGSWGKKATTSPAWNISGEPCSGAAIDSTDFKNPNFNPAIKCDCSYNNGTTCHITQLRVYALDVEGTIPEELQNLTYLKDLDLSQNYLTGPLPAFIGNLTELQYFTVGTNALSGTIPKELGKLQKLISLGVGANNFSGSLPSELGNLSNLQQLYVDSCGVGGEFPSTVSSLKNLQTLWASDNNFTGKIPDFSETNLTTLRMQGNSFEGPIPSSFSSLTSLTDLRLGDISNGSSTLAFISNLTSLSKLVLRNSRISDAIPPDFSLYTNLQILDLSFNNLTGQLPQSLFNLSSLSYLFLGNNSLSGSLPTSKSNSLLNIDVSYNQLSGSFPSWVSQQNLKLNLVANNFVVDSSNISALPSGLNCLQRDIPCNRGSPIYSSFAITCGGNKTITSSDGTVYEIDSKTLTTASYYVTDSNRWAVSSVGTFMDASNPDYILNSASQFPNTLETELYQTQRLSPSSLRYYGLGLENGNYTIKLHFAETQILDPPTWKSVGRRVFDIYIQGDRKEKDFDIKKEAGEKSFRAVVKEYTAPVTNNFLDIHFFWSGKGTCCVPTQGYYGSSISAISVYPFDFTPTVSNKPPSTDSTNKKTGLVAGIAAGAVALGLFTLLVILIYRQRRRLGKDDDEDLLEISARPDTFTYMELKTATENFNPNNKLGEGGFGPVFKGKVLDGRIVAVKQLSAASRQGKRQFMAEIATISAVQHRNLVKLYGCCIEGGKRLLVYEYLENKSLDQALFGENNLHLDWPTRFEICLGTARGLAYLHEESRVRIVHRDVKASNILLDADLIPKISDFGLAKLYDDKKTHISTRVAGTIGYLAPEYAMRGHLTEKADVFGFGVVALEVLSGRPNSDQSLEAEKVYLLEWAWSLRENKRELEMVDPWLSSFNEEEAIRIINVALLCTQASPMLRPPMSRVVAMLAGDIEVGEVTTRPGYLTDWQFNDISSSFASGGVSKPSMIKSVNIQTSIPSNITMGSDTKPMPSPSGPLLDEVITEGR
ncbi:probable LRR receptor-like serine/threonine-protein kinase At1g56130 isoform X2 [Elaeis guineensis]|uniref:non-specific serine/threonine protein kinase n=1 Tax=Elaeis guineensis var. tenera TaxID=51953 RepID=A0A6J0PS69_ELAGV|nr:probable LRR receptor-like serine/threonine-protein kinase At1g56140 isoform X2 [Elaeis guineensis]